MISPNTRSALAALDAVRPLLVRLDERRHPEDAAADLIEGWAGVETALRAMVGGSSLGGQALVSEVRAQGLLDYPHAHALLGFLAARDRATRPDYHPSGEDVAAARAGFQAIEAANGVGIAADTATYPATPPRGAQAGLPPSVAPPDAPLPPPQPRPAPRPVSREVRDTEDTLPRVSPGRDNGAGAPPPLETYARAPRTRRSPALLAGLALLLLAVGTAAYFLFSGPRGERELNEGVAAYQARRPEDARRLLEAAARANPQSARPHIYLGRIARDGGDIQRATVELTTALRLEPNNGLAAREMGQLQLQAGQTQLAKRFLARAIEADATDRVALGWLGCAFSREGNSLTAERFYARAGAGDWTACRQAAPAGQPGAASGVTAPGVAAPGGVQPLRP